ncbi:helix-turn-helix domain-containing protein [Fructobacillus fructosus]|uniref:helix-turn-helix domain-containing protein n=1 Tax=Fructobacillus fructosus TaxID=1631 RepID=UPI003BACF705
MVVELLTIRRNALSYTILSFEDRAVIATLRKEGHFLQSIANKTSFAKYTIHYELR